MEKEKLVFEAMDRENAKRKALSEAMDKVVKSDRVKKLEKIEQEAMARAKKIATEQYYRIKAELLEQENFDVPDEREDSYKVWAKNINNQLNRDIPKEEPQKSNLEQIQELLAVHLGTNK